MKRAPKHESHHQKVLKPSKGGSMTLKDLLNTNGCAGIGLTGEQIHASAFIKRVDEGTHSLFTACMSDALSPSVEAAAQTAKNGTDRAAMVAWERGHGIWTGLDDKTKKAFVDTLDLRSTNGRETLFQAPKTQAFIKSFARRALDVHNESHLEDLAYYLEDRVKYATQGDYRIHNSWSAETGFGEYAHITTSEGIRACLQLRDVLQQNNLDTQLKGDSYMIYTPPGGKEISAHTDGPSPESIISMLEAFALKNGGRFPTTVEWMQDTGVQSLVHFDGGKVDGYTYAIGPMTPKKLYHCLKAVQDKSIEASDADLFPTVDKSYGNARRHFLEGGSGPSFMRWKENIVKFNAVLAEHSEKPIGEMPIRPGAQDTAGAFAALWANGFPHGSAPNTVRRISTTASLAVVGPNYTARDERVPKRVAALTTIAYPSASEAQREVARKTISSQTVPLEGRKFYSMWFDSDKLADGTGGFYRSIAPTPTDAAMFVKAWNEGNPKYAPTADDWRRFELAKIAAPPGGQARRPRFETPPNATEE